MEDGAKLVYLITIKTAANWQMSDQSAGRSTNNNRPTTDLGVLIFADNAVRSLGEVDNILPRQWTGVA